MTDAVDDGNDDDGFHPADHESLGSDNSDASEVDGQKHDAYLDKEFQVINVSLKPLNILTEEQTEGDAKKYTEDGGAESTCFERCIAANDATDEYNG